MVFMRGVTCALFLDAETREHHEVAFVMVADVGEELLHAVVSGRERNWLRCCVGRSFTMRAGLSSLCMDVWERLLLVVACSHVGAWVVSVCLLVFDSTTVCGKARAEAREACWSRCLVRSTQWFKVVVWVFDNGGEAVGVEDVSQTCCQWLGCVDHTVKVECAVAVW